jgi:hypothetical protein
MQVIDNFLQEIEIYLKNNFAKYEIEILLKTEKSLKVKIYFDKIFFIAIRYNTRNERMDFALIYNKARIFGYDNLKNWHYHPFEDSDKHIPCNKPSVDKMLSDIKEIYDKLNK